MKRCAYNDFEQLEIKTSLAMTKANETILGEMPNMHKWYGYTPTLRKRPEPQMQCIPKVKK